MKILKRYDNLGRMSTDMLTLAIGILLLTRQRTGLFVLFVLSVILLFWIGLQRILAVAAKAKPKERMDALVILLSLGFAITFLIKPTVFLNWMTLFIGIYGLAAFFFCMISFYVKKVDQFPGAARQFFKGLGYGALALVMLLGSSMSLKQDVLTMIAGIFFIVYGSIGFLFHLIYTSRFSTKKIRRNWSYAMPVLFSAFVPLHVYISIHRLIQQIKDIPENTKDADLFVYIYLKGKGPEVFGHMDIAYQGTIYSYGCHDSEHRGLFGTFGDGVLIVSEEKSFLRESIYTDHKTILGYGLKLTDEEKTLVEKRIDQLMQRAVPWKCKAALKDEMNEDMSGCCDYPSRVYKETKAPMYKFTKGRFRTYFIAVTNCVNVADYMIRNEDLNLVDLSGFVTPGAYLSFLNTEYNKHDSIVNCRILFEESMQNKVIDRTE